MSEETLIAIVIVVPVAAFVVALVAVILADRKMK
jgi:hypothetical protein